MNSYIKSFFIILGFFLVFSGFTSISYKSEIFNSKSILLVHCELNGCNGVNCNSQAVLKKKALCESITLKCKDCVDWTYTGCLCNGSISCLLNNQPYYGTWVNCGIE